MDSSLWKISIWHRELYKNCSCDIINNDAKAAGVRERCLCTSFRCDKRFLHICHKSHHTFNESKSLKIVYFRRAAICFMRFLSISSRPETLFPLLIRRFQQRSDFNAELCCKNCQSLELWDDKEDGKREIYSIYLRFRNWKIQMRARLSSHKIQTHIVPFADCRRDWGSQPWKARRNFTDENEEVSRCDVLFAWWRWKENSPLLNFPTWSITYGLMMISTESWWKLFSEKK